MSYFIFLLVKMIFWMCDVSILYFVICINLQTLAKKVTCSFLTWKPLSLSIANLLSSPESVCVCRDKCHYSYFWYVREWWQYVRNGGALLINGICDLAIAPVSPSFIRIFIHGFYLKMYEPLGISVVSKSEPP